MSPSDENFLKKSPKVLEVDSLYLMFPAKQLTYANQIWNGCTKLGIKNFVDIFNESSFIDEFQVLSGQRVEHQKEKKTYEYNTIQLTNLSVVITIPFRNIEEESTQSKFCKFEKMQSLHEYFKDATIVFYPCVAYF